MNRRESLKSLLGASTMLGACRLFAQSTGEPVNEDTHDMLAGEDKASNALMMHAMKTGGIIPVLTRSYDNLRSCTNTRETTLTPALVRRNPLRKHFSMVLPGDARGLEAQPLFLPDVTIADGTTHDMCLLATMANQVWAYDANDGTPLWMVRLGKPINGSRAIDYWTINDHWGILSTPVIDSDTKAVYCVAWISSDGTANNGTHWFFELNLRDGSQSRPPIQLTKPGKMPRKQRSSLTLASIGGKKTVLIPWGTILETAQGAHGYITAVDLATWKVTAEFNTTAKGSGAGVWQAGQGFLVDSGGDFYCMTGNGDYDGVNNWGECFLKLRYNGSSIRVIDHYSPFQDKSRPAAYDDMDLGSGAPSLIPELGLLFGAGKDSVLYTLPWRKLASPTLPPIWFGFYPGNGTDPTNLANLDKMWFNRSHHIHSSSAVWKAADGWRVFCWPENGNLRAWHMDANGAHYLGCSAEVASANAPVPPGGMPGGQLCLSANGNTDGIVWACLPLGDANRTVSQGCLYAYDATTLGKYSDGSGSIEKIWQSSQYTYNKFNPPVVNAGRVYVPTYSGSVDVWGI
jgi:hypothetical protein